MVTIQYMQILNILMFSICIYCIVAKLCMTNKKKEEEQTKMNKPDIFLFGFLAFDKD